MRERVKEKKRGKEREKNRERKRERERGREREKERKKERKREKGRKREGQINLGFFFFPLCCPDLFFSFFTNAAGFSSWLAEVYSQQTWREREKNRKNRVFSSKL